MRKILGALAAVAILTFPYFTSATVASGKPAQAFVIDDDDGGVVDTFIMWYRRLLAGGQPVILRGMCVSACTFVLILPHDQVCVEPTASLGFHNASVNGRQEPGVTAVLAQRYYPAAVLAWLADKKMRDVPVFMHASEIIALGLYPACAVPDKAVAIPPHDPAHD